MFDDPQGDWNGDDSPAAHEGEQYAEVQALEGKGGGLRQTLKLEKGQQYRLSFWHRKREPEIHQYAKDHTTDPFVVKLTDGHFLDADGEDTDTQQYQVNPGSSWQEWKRANGASYVFVADSDYVELTFTKPYDADWTGWGGLVDDVVVEPAGVELIVDGEDWDAEKAIELKKDNGFLGNYTVKCYYPKGADEYLTLSWDKKPDGAEIYETGEGDDKNMLDLPYTWWDDDGVRTFELKVKEPVPKTKMTLTLTDGPSNSEIIYTPCADCIGSCAGQRPGAMDAGTGSVDLVMGLGPVANGAAGGSVSLYGDRPADFVNNASDLDASVHSSVTVVNADAPYVPWRAEAWTEWLDLGTGHSAYLRNFSPADGGGYAIAYGDSGGYSSSEAFRTLRMTANHAPTASDDSATAMRETAVTIDALANDTDADPVDVLTVDAVTQGANGSVTNNGSEVTYTPDAGFTGVDSFEYTVTDGKGLYDTATVTVDVVAARPPENPANAVSGIEYETFDGTWTSLPDFDSLTAADSGVMDAIDITAGRDGTDHFAMRWSGYVEVPTDGTYTFYTASDDGSQLFIGDTLVVDNDGQHSVWEASGTIDLQAGRHAMTVTYFEGSGGEQIDVSFEGGGLSKQEIPAANLFHADDPAAGEQEFELVVSQFDGDLDAAQNRYWRYAYEADEAAWTLFSAPTPAAGDVLSIERLAETQTTRQIEGQSYD
ncbi:MAG: cadherin-like domain-containing protein, partial [Phycisphaerae bacterium]|nr:cadherin-like domain-containing protein [Phycisphaerae bacterium]